MRDPDEGLDLHQDARFQRREWRAQRIGMVLLFAFVGAGALGLCGGRGPLSGATLHGDGLRLDYARIGRSSALAELRVELARAGAAVLHLDRNWLEQVEVQGVTPRPAAIVGHGETLAFRFDVADAALPLVVVFHTKFSRAGVLRGRVALAGGPSLAFTQFVHF